MRRRAPIYVSLASATGARSEFFLQDILEREARRLVFALEIRLHLFAFLVSAQALNRKPDATFLAVNLDDQRFELVADFAERRRLIDALVAQLRNMNETLDTFFEFDEDAEVC